MAVPTVDLTQIDPEEEIQRRLAAGVGPAPLSLPQIAPPGKPSGLMARPGEPNTPQAIPNATIKSGETWRDKVTPLTAEIAPPNMAAVPHPVSLPPVGGPMPAPAPPSSDVGAGEAPTAGKPAGHMGFHFYPGNLPPEAMLSGLPPIKPAKEAMAGVTPVPRVEPLNQAHMDEYHRLTTPGQESSKPGVAQLMDKARGIHNPALRTIGEMGAGLLRGVDVAGSFLAPNIARNIPGTSLYHTGLVNRAAGRVAEDQAQQEAQAKIGLEQAQGEEARARANGDEWTEVAGMVGPSGQPVQMNKRSGEYRYGSLPGAQLAKPASEWQPVPRVTGPNGEPVELNKATGETRYGTLSGLKPVKQPGETQEQNKLEFQGTISKVASAGLPTGPKSIDRSLDVARAQGVISQQEYAAARAYQSANPTPATNLTVHIAGQENAENLRQRGKYYLSNGKVVRGDQLSSEEAADAVPIKDPQQFKAGATVANTVSRSFNHLADDDVKIFDDPKARAVLATALSDEQARNMGLLVAGTGGSISLPGGAGKIIDQLLENHAVPENIRREVKNYIVDYWGMRDKLLAMQMEMQGGKIGRGNAVFFNAMLGQLPGPGTSDSVMARRQLNALSETMHSLKEQYGDLADVEPKQLQGDTGEPQTRAGRGKGLSPAGQKYLDSVLGH